MTPINISLLHAPSATPGGKFYIGIEDDRWPHVVHGPNTANNKGRFVPVSGSSQVRSKVSEKLSADYTRADLSMIPAATQKNLIERLSSALKIPKDQISLSDNAITFGGSAQQQPHGQRPRPRRRRRIEAWI